MFWIIYHSNPNNIQTNDSYAGVVQIFPTPSQWLAVDHRWPATCSISSCSNMTLSPQLVFVISAIKGYAQTSNEASLPQEGYEDRTLSGTTINRWYRFFRKLCRNDFQRQGGRICVKAQRALSEKFRLGQKF